ncbi:MAG: HypC/HybG/HupF family hydrogenase formation chaperone [Aigarchaeota archaeon]|nr:HypC/HybG/HupF family hydrogenase formation chaperone [Aigarchaeota archaeon]MCX8192604.1 HypC/HybG/HupF family hydrogenase formation chaperone [Nitrososphaeria archaeon]MDW7985660.1 HypC/HybG/HupF family hydrogenase formation chaperone [Nitrososphaerota archaeon]
MCWGVYGKVVEVVGENVKVDFGGVVKEVFSAVDELSPGDFVIVHAGIVISKLSEEDFLDSFKYVKEIAEKLVEEGEFSIEELREIDKLVKRLTSSEK